MRSRDYPVCVECKTSRNPHKAKGYCTACYLRVRMRSRGRWPVSLDACIRCGVHKSGASYYSRGLCSSCYSTVRGDGSLREWPMRYEANVALSLAQAIGATEGSQRCELPLEEFRGYCSGGEMSAEVAAVVRRVLSEVRA